MSSDSPARRRKISEKVNEQGRRAPLFGVHHEPLPEKPTPLQATRDPFADLPEGRPRAIRMPAPSGRADAAGPRQPMPLERTPASELLVREPAPAPAEPERRTLARKALELHQADALAGRFVERVPAYQRAAPPESPIDFVRGRPWLLVLVAAVSLIVFWFTSSTPKTIISGFNGSGPVAVSNAISNVFRTHNVPAGQHVVIGQPTISAQFIDSVLTHYGSPAQGTGKIWLEMGQQYGIDPAYALAFFIHESSAGTNPGWAGIKPGGGSTHNVGNIICAGYATCFGRFRDYDSWQAGIEDWYKLIATEYVGDRGAVTIEQIIPIYAPAFENDVNNYIQTVIGLADTWRQGVVR
jgi:Mannosyl-glycoprotein endo-beta-N-acetylglucosaminidase